MIWPPFISARAIETRCCCPPESWLGRLREPVAQTQPAQQLLGALFPFGGRKSRIDGGDFYVFPRP
jgi:hypothetical protein